MTKFYKRLRPLLGTYVEIGIDPEFSNCELATTKAFEKIEKLQKLLSFHDPKSDLSLLNNSYEKKPIMLNPLSVTVLKKAQRMTVASQGLFNFTVGGKLVRLGVLPKQTQARKKNSGEAKDLEVKGLKAKLRRPILITLDGIAKGYAVDLAVRTLKKLGVTSGYVNAGGDVRIFGSAKLPLYLRNKQGSLENLGVFSNIAVATSQTMTHQNPQFPGFIVSTNKKSIPVGTWTVLASTAWKADALTKVASLALPRDRQKIVKKLGGRLFESNVSKES